MSRIDHLPVYQATYSFVLEIYRIKEKLPKSLKHDLGVLASGSSLKLLKLVIEANASKDKEPLLKLAYVESVTLWSTLRLLYDLKGVSSGQLKVLSEKLVEIQKQILAWSKWQKTQKK